MDVLDHIPEVQRKRIIAGVVLEDGDYLQMIESLEHAIETHIENGNNINAYKTAVYLSHILCAHQHGMITKPQYLQQDLKSLISNNFRFVSSREAEGIYDYSRSIDDSFISTLHGDVTGLYAALVVIEQQEPQLQGTAELLLTLDFYRQLSIFEEVASRYDISSPYPEQRVLLIGYNQHSWYNESTLFTQMQKTMVLVEYNGLISIAATKADSPLLKGGKYDSVIAPNVFNDVGVSIVGAEQTIQIFGSCAQLTNTGGFCIHIGNSGGLQQSYALASNQQFHNSIGQKAISMEQLYRSYVMQQTREVDLNYTALSRQYGDNPQAIRQR